MTTNCSQIGHGMDLRPAGLLAVLLIAASSPLAAGDSRTRVLEAYGRLPLRFERNESQVSRPVRYLARASGYTMLVTPTEMVLSPAGSPALRVRLAAARRQATVEGEGELPGRTNYLIGGDPKGWRTGVVSYGKVRCRGVYPGIDVVYHGSGKELEYDFVVAPGADPGRIRLRYEGTRGLRLDGEGNLVVALEGGEMTKRAPLVYQEAGATKQPVRGRWVLRGKNEAGFEVGPYDRTRTLVIDPVLSYSTYLGGNGGDEAWDIAVDGSGSAYITGQTTSTDFPTQGQYLADQASTDAFVTKLSPSGNSLVYSTYLGGSDFDYGHAVVVDRSGSAYVTGSTYSTDFPTQSSYQPDQPYEDAYVAKLSPSGDALVYSTYLGGSLGDRGWDIAVDGSGSAYVTGETSSTDFPTLNPYQPDQGSIDIFVTKLSPLGNSLVYSTYLGGSGADYGKGIALDGAGSAHVTGRTDSADFPTHSAYQGDQAGTDAFVTRLSPSGSSSVYSTYLGGADYDQAQHIAVDGLGNAYVTGQTASTDFPTLAPYQTDQAGTDAFVTKLAPSGTLAYSTYLGGGGFDEGFGIAVDDVGSAHVTGRTYSTDFPTVDPLQTDPDAGEVDAFVTKLSASGSTLLYSTYLGGNYADYGDGIAVDVAGSVYVAGDTGSTDFPTLNPYQGNQFGVDVFVTKLAPPSTTFFTVPPCRVIDTRDATGHYGGPALAAGADRTFTLGGQCGVSPTARAVSVNVTVTQATAGGNLRLYPAGAALPLASTINYSAGMTRANNAIVLLSAGAATVRCTQASGTVHFVLDVNGYFEEAVLGTTGQSDPLAEEEASPAF